MTELMYFTSDALVSSAQVLECAAMERGFVVVLDRTLFHPQGGGQRADAGTIGHAAVQHVVAKDGVVEHRVDKRLPPGRVDMSIDPDRRAESSRLHSAGHLVGNALQALGARPTRAHHWPQEAKVWFGGPISGDPAEFLGRLQDLVDGYVAADLDRVIAFDSTRRTVKFGKLQEFSCGGTHVLRTGQIGRCRLIGIAASKMRGNYIEYAIR